MGDRMINVRNTALSELHSLRPGWPCGPRARLAAIVSLAIALVPSPGSSADAQTIAHREPEEVRFTHCDLQLGGLWFVPAGDMPFPAAVVIRGSGPSRRDSYWTRAVIRVLLDAGVAVLLPDKRGSDSSAGDWRTASFEELAGDALAAVQFARNRPEIRSDRVGLIGLSQGGKIAPLAAADSPDVAWVINLVGASTTFREQVSWEMYHTFREAGLKDEPLENALALQIAAEAYVDRDVEWSVYRRLLDSALAGPAAEVARGFPASPDAWQWGFFRRVIDFDPLPHWQRTRQPVLVFYGEEDHNAPAVRSAYRLLRAFRESGHPDATVRVIDDAGHGLWDPRSPDPHQPRLHPVLVDVLHDWLRARR